MTDASSPSSRREFLSAMGAISALGLVSFESWPTHASHPATTRSIGRPRGLAAPDDFLFASELVYLQTGSLGPTPRPVMERTIAAWKELELNPSFYGYGAHEHAMDDVVRASGRAPTAARPACAARSS